jgi:PAS domain S-box-containing protein
MVRVRARPHPVRAGRSPITKPTRPKRRVSAAAIEAAVIATVAAAAFVLASVSDLHESVDRLEQTQTAVHSLRGVLVGVAVLALGFCAFAMRRWRELRRVSNALRRAEAQAVAAESKYREAVESAGDGIGVGDSEERFIFANRAAAEVFGLQPGELAGRRLDSMVTAESRERVRTETERRRAGERGAYEVEVVRPDGQYRRVQITATPHLDSEGHFAGAFGVSRDVTGARRIQDALRESEERFRTIADVAQDAIIRMDGAGRASYWSPAAERMFGHTADEVMGRVLHEFLAPARFRPAHLAAFPKFQQAGTGAAVGRTVELAAVRRDGTEIPVELSLSALRVGDEWQAVGIVRDVSERKRAEADLARKNAELAALNEQKNQFLGMAAHDLRNPLAVVLTTSSFLLEPESSALPCEKKMDFIGRIKSSSEFMLRLTEDLLDVAKIEAGKLELDMVESDLGRVVAENVAMNGVLAERKGIRVEAEVTPNLPDSVSTPRKSSRCSTTWYRTRSSSPVPEPRSG